MAPNLFDSLARRVLLPVATCFVACACQIGCLSPQPVASRTSPNGAGTPMPSETVVSPKSVDDLRRAVGTRIRLVGRVCDLKEGVVLKCDWMNFGPQDEIHLPAAETFEEGKWPRELLGRPVQMIGILEFHEMSAKTYFNPEGTFDPATGITLPVMQNSHTENHWKEYSLHHIWIRLLPDS